MVGIELYLLFADPVCEVMLSIPRPPDGADAGTCGERVGGCDLGCCCFGASVGCFSYLISFGVGGTLPL
jgi:hypothetical protein